jgi:peptide/nickel transport system permease protein
MTERPRAATDRRPETRKEAYFTASQGQLIWARFKKQRAAMVAGVVLVLLIF